MTTARNNSPPTAIKTIPQSEPSAASSVSDAAGVPVTAGAAVIAGDVADGVGEGWAAAAVTTAVVVVVVVAAAAAKDTLVEPEKMDVWVSRV